MQVLRFEFQLFREEMSVVSSLSQVTVADFSEVEI